MDEGCTGAFGDETYPALTALAAAAMVSDPNLDEKAELPPHVMKSLDFLASKQKTDGGIYGKGLAAYNTALSLTALAFAGEKKYEKVMLDARRFLINQQSDFDVRGEADNAFDGGIGYGGTYAHSDLSNTHFVLEALHYFKLSQSDSGTELDKKLQLDFDAAITFVSRTQNLPGAFKDYATTEENKGSFNYFPGDSKAGEDKLEDGRVALRGYGSMSYAGLLSFIYAGMDKDDPRIEAVLEWLKKNYTLDENPGLEGQGLFYYYHTMAKALAIMKMPELELADGTKVNWRKDLSLKLFDLQAADGSWTNETGRWWENDPILVTSYAVLTLEHIYHNL